MSKNDTFLHCGHTTLTDTCSHTWRLIYLPATWVLDQVLYAECTKCKVTADPELALDIDDRPKRYR